MNNRVKYLLITSYLVMAVMGVAFLINLDDKEEVEKEEDKVE